MREDTEVRIWDPLVRIFHWTLVVAFSVAYFTEDDLMTIHTWVGYVICGLIVFRLVWGFIGPRYARFSDFVHPPREVLHHVRDTLSLRAPRHLGHNPAGGMMIVIMLIVLSLTCVSGLLVYGGGEHKAGPLAPLLTLDAGFIPAALADDGDSHGRGGDEAVWVEALEDIHEWLANFMIILVVIHVSGVLLESLIFRENLIRAMITGTKRRD